MLIRSIINLFVCICLVSNVKAADKTIGNWYVQVMKDPFSTKKKSFAVTASGTAGALAIRCFPDSGLSVIVRLGGEKHFDAGAKVPFKYRADEHEIVEDAGEAFGEGAIEISNSAQVRKDALSAATLYFRISTPDAAIIDLEFKTRGAAKALAQINQDCPADEGKVQTPDTKPAK